MFVEQKPTGSKTIANNENYHYFITLIINNIL